MSGLIDEILDKQISHLEKAFRHLGACHGIEEAMLHRNEIKLFSEEELHILIGCRTEIDLLLSSLKLKKETNEHNLTYAKSVKNDTCKDASINLEEVKE